MNEQSNNILIYKDEVLNEFYYDFQIILFLNEFIHFLNIQFKFIWVFIKALHSDK